MQGYFSNSGENIWKDRRYVSVIILSTLMLKIVHYCVHDDFIKNRNKV